MVGDERWAGSYGVDADFVARDNCSVMWADLLDVKVRPNECLETFTNWRPLWRVF